MDVKRLECTNVAALPDWALDMLFELVPWCGPPRGEPQVASMGRAALPHVCRDFRRVFDQCRPLWKVMSVRVASSREIELKDLRALRTRLGWAREITMSGGPAHVAVAGHASCPSEAIYGDLGEELVAFRVCSCQPDFLPFLRPSSCPALRTLHHSHPRFYDGNFVPPIPGDLQRFLQARRVDDANDRHLSALSQLQQLKMNRSSIDMNHVLGHADYVDVGAALASLTGLTALTYMCGAAAPVDGVYAPEIPVSLRMALAVLRGLQDLEVISPFEDNLDVHSVLDSQEPLRLGALTALTRLCSSGPGPLVKGLENMPNLSEIKLESAENFMEGEWFEVDEEEGSSDSSDEDPSDDDED